MARGRNRRHGRKIPYVKESRRTPSYLSQRREKECQTRTPIGRCKKEGEVIYFSRDATD